MVCVDFIGLSCLGKMFGRFFLGSYLEGGKPENKIEKEAICQKDLELTSKAELTFCDQIVGVKYVHIFHIQIRNSSNFKKSITNIVMPPYLSGAIYYINKENKFWLA